MKWAVCYCDLIRRSGQSGRVDIHCWKGAKQDEMSICIGAEDEMFSSLIPSSGSLRPLVHYPALHPAVVFISGLPHLCLGIQKSTTSSALHFKRLTFSLMATVLAGVLSLREDVLMAIEEISKHKTLRGNLSEQGRLN